METGFVLRLGVGVAVGFGLENRPPNPLAVVWAGSDVAGVVVAGVPKLKPVPGVAKENKNIDLFDSDYLSKHKIFIGLKNSCWISSSHRVNTYQHQRAQQ